MPKGDEENKKRIIFTKKLIEYLSNNVTEDNLKRTFYISPITISEIISLTTNRKLNEFIYEPFHSSNIEIISFNEKVGMHLNSLCKEYLKKEKLNELAKQLEFNVDNLVMAREWITRDFMIIATSSYKNCDVVLTADKKTFEPICKILNIFCALT
ncbi:MAG: hypothetical protein WKG06_13785 [Segetibacter sp.]